MKTHKFLQIRSYVWIPIILISQTVFAQNPDFHLPFLEKEYKDAKICDVPLNELRHFHVDSLLTVLHNRYPNSFEYEKVGQSIEGRSINLVKLGHGTTRVLLWSQMHGDEPTATAALFDVFNYLMQNQQKEFVRTIFDNLTILAVPMLNPDGAQRFTRRNMQGLDINRDARDLQSPEGKILRNLQQTYQPDFGFNLHDQNARRTVGSSNKQVAISLMAPPFDTEANDNPVRIRAKKIVSVVYQALAPYLYGHVSKYDAGFMPRAFGDMMQRWGTSTTLIESGGWKENRNPFLQKMNFIALVTVFHAIATGDYQQANPGIYDAIPQNDKNIYDLLISDVTVYNGIIENPFKTDIAINFEPVDESSSISETIGRIVDIGDMNYFAANDTIDGSELTLIPGMITVLQNPPQDSNKLIEQLQRLMLSGFTTVLITYPQNDFMNGNSITKNFNSFAGNIGRLLRLENEMANASDTLSIIKILAAQSVGVVKKDSNPITGVLFNWLNKPIIDQSELQTPEGIKNQIPPDLINFTSKQAKRWKIPNRGSVRIGQIADLILLSKNTSGDYKINRVMVKGHTVWKDRDWIKVPLSGERWFWE